MAVVSSAVVMSGWEVRALIPLCLLLISGESLWRRVPLPRMAVLRAFNLEKHCLLASLVW